MTQEQERANGATLYKQQPPNFIFEDNGGREGAEVTHEDTIDNRGGEANASLYSSMADENISPTEKTVADYGANGQLELEQPEDEEEKVQSNNALAGLVTKVPEVSS